jgi:hypothetical protein
MDEIGMTGAELATLELAVSRALRARDDAALNVIGRGEITVALGWPTEAPRFVCKRITPFTESEFDRYARLVEEYVDLARAGGLHVVDTAVMATEHLRGVVGYVVQPLLEPGTLGDRVLAAAVPDPDHPFVAALAESLDLVGPTFSIDAQVTNFSWDGANATLIDVGTPFLWTDEGRLRFDMRPFARMIPAPARGLAVRELTKTIDRWSAPRGVAVDIVANLVREGLTDWVDPMLTALNRRLDPEHPITTEEAQRHYQADLKTFPRLARLQAVERWWQETVRRRHYEWFVWTMYDV